MDATEVKLTEEVESWFANGGSLDACSVSQEIRECMKDNEYWQNRSEEEQEEYIDRFIKKLSGYMAYLVDTKDGDTDVYQFDSIDEAMDAASDKWNHLTQKEKISRAEFYVGYGVPTREEYVNGLLPETGITVTYKFM